MFLELAAEVKKFNASVGFVVQPFTSSALRYSSKTGGNPIGFEPILQNCKLDKVARKKYGLNES